GQGAQFLQVVEDEAGRMRREGRDDRQPRFLVNDAVEPLVGESARRIRNRFFLAHRSVAPESSKGWRRTKVARRRTARPSPTPNRRSPGAPPRSFTTRRRSCKRRRPKTSLSATDDTTRRCPD